MMNDSIDMLISHQQIKTRIQQLATQISEDYRQTDASMVLIGLLNGAFIFLADLCREITVPHQVGFLTVSSYGNSTKSSGQVNIVQDVQFDITGKHVLIVEDIIDSGHTLTKVVNMLQQRQPASVEICTLIDKPSRREVEVSVKYTGFAIADRFIVGYGLDYDQNYRHLPYIGVVKA